MPLQQLGLPQSVTLFTAHALADKLSGSLSLQLTCKLFYLSFPRDIHNSGCIVVQAVAQENCKPGFHFCPLDKRYGHVDRR